MRTEAGVKYIRYDPACLKQCPAITGQYLDSHAVYTLLFRRAWLSPYSSKSHAQNNEDENSILLQNVGIPTYYTAVSSLMNGNNIHHTSKFISSENGITCIFI
jgi:hypothetical protein